MKVRIVPAGSERDPYLPLLLLADESRAQVDGYYQAGDLYALDDEAGQPLGLVLTIAQPEDSVELKAVAVDGARHNEGIGKLLLAAVLADLRARGVQRVTVGTASCGVGQLAFYQKVGFRLLRIERDFFTPMRGYPAGTEENGIPLRDMVWMDQEL